MEDARCPKEGRIPDLGSDREFSKFPWNFGCAVLVVGLMYLGKVLQLERANL